MDNPSIGSYLDWETASMKRRMMILVLLPCLLIMCMLTACSGPGKGAPSNEKDDLSLSMKSENAALQEEQGSGRPDSENMEREAAAVQDAGAEERLTASDASEPDTTSTEHKEEFTMRIVVNDEMNKVTFELNGSNAVRSLYDQLPLEIKVENYSNNEKIFYPENLNTSDTPMSKGKTGNLAYFAPWNDVVMFYGDGGPYNGLYDLGKAVAGAENIRNLSGTITIKAE